MVKLTPELINQSMQFINPCRDRELDLRGNFHQTNKYKYTYMSKIFKVRLNLHLHLGYKIPQIENLGATLDQFDTIDFSENDIRRLDNFPFLPRIKCLLLNNNRIVRIAENLQEFLPNLTSMILTGNNIQELSDLEPLLQFPKLETLSLLNNPVTTKPQYREFVVHK